MENLSKLLERFSKILNRNAATKEIIIKTIENRTRVALPPKNILLKEGILTIEASPSAKNEIRLKEDSILRELGELHNIPIAKIFYK